MPTKKHWEEREAALRHALFRFGWDYDLWLTWLQVKRSATNARS